MIQQASKIYDDMLFMKEKLVNDYDMEISQINEILENKIENYTTSEYILCVIAYSKLYDEFTRKGRDFLNDLLVTYAMVDDFIINIIYLKILDELIFYKDKFEKKLGKNMNNLDIILSNNKFRIKATEDGQEFIFDAELIRTFYKEMFDIYFGYSNASVYAEYIKQFQ